MPLNRYSRFGPSGIISPGRRAPHEDVGRLAVGLIGGVQGIGEDINTGLDVPFNATIKVKGPHRLADGFLDFVADIYKDTIRKITRA